MYTEAELKFFKKFDIEVKNPESPFSSPMITLGDERRLEDILTEKRKGSLTYNRPDGGDFCIIHTINPALLEIGFWRSFGKTRKDALLTLFTEYLAEERWGVRQIFGLED